MDFASLMSKELGKSRKPADSQTKFLKRSDLEAERRAAYLAEQKALDKERETKAASKRKHDEEVATEHAKREEKRRKLAEESRIRREEQEAEEQRTRRKRLGLSELVPEKRQEAEEGLGAGDDIPDAELFTKLREMGEPTVLFGESHLARLRRYRKLTVVITKGPIPTTLELVEEADMRVDEKVPKDDTGRKWLFRQLASYFTMILTVYERTMEAEKRDTTASKNAYSAMVQTRENMKPVSDRSSQPHSCGFLPPTILFRRK